MQYTVTMYVFQPVTGSVYRSVLVCGMRHLRPGRLQVYASIHMGCVQGYTLEASKFGGNIAALRPAFAGLGTTVYAGHISSSAVAQLCMQSIATSA
jgi:hypothetical protein